MLAGRIGQQRPDAATWLGRERPTSVGQEPGGFWLSRGHDHSRDQGILMMRGGKLQTSRYEFKYLLENAKALAIGNHVRMHSTPDAYTKGEGYKVHSLYFDSPDLRLCRQTMCGEKNRFKLRIRFYDDEPHSPIFLEVKRRVTVAVLKTRAGVHRDAFDRLIRDFVPDVNYLLRRDDKNIEALYNFCRLARSVRAKPAAYTSYVREAYESAHGNSQRVTFDRYLRAGAFTGKLSVADLDRWPIAPVDGVVFEMKFTERFPAWMQAVAEEFELQRISVPKYVECVNVVDHERARKLQVPRRIILDAPLRVMEQSRPKSSFFPPETNLTTSGYARIHC